MIAVRFVGATNAGTEGKMKRPLADRHIAYTDIETTAFGAVRKKPALGASIASLASCMLPVQRSWRIAQRDGMLPWLHAFEDCWRDSSRLLREEKHFVRLNVHYFINGVEIVPQALGKPY